MVNLYLGMMHVCNPHRSPGNDADILRYYLDHVPNEPLLDTAYYYGLGSGQRRLGDLLALLPPEARPRLASKANPWLDNEFESGRLGQLGAAGFERQLRGSLADLGVDEVDTFFLHAYDYETPLLETLESVRRNRDGYRRWGLSNFSKAQVLRVLDLCEEHGVPEPRVYQGMYNVLCRKVEELFPVLRDRGIEFWAYNPLLGGLVVSGAGAAGGGGRFSNPTYRGIFGGLRDACREIGGEEGAGLRRALLWLRDHSKLSADDAILLGASTPKQLQQSMSVLLDGVPLSANEAAHLEKVWSTTPRQLVPEYWY